MLYWANPYQQYISKKNKINKKISSVLNKNKYILGNEVLFLEKEFSKFIGSKHSVAVANGTDAIEIVLKSLEIGYGDEVLTVSHTALATVAAIESSGAKPVLVDVDSEYYTIDLNKIKSFFNKKIKAIIAVHIYGQSADIKELQIFCKKKGIHLIEDCSQAHGSSFRKKKLGTFGIASCFSCYPTKNLGAIGDAGLIVTSNKSIAKKCHSIRQYGLYNGRSLITGRNSRLDEIQAAILRVKLRELKKDNHLRVKVSKYYNTQLKNLPIKLPKVRKNSTHVFHLYVVQVKKRNALLNFMKKNDVILGVHYLIPIHLQPAYKNRLIISDMSITEQISKNSVSLPIYPEIKKHELDKVIKLLKIFYDKK